MLYISLLLWSDYINNAGKASVQHNEIIFLISVDSYGNSLANNLLHHQWPQITAVFKNLSRSWKLRRLITWTERDRKMCQKLLWLKLLTLSCSHFFLPLLILKVDVQPCAVSKQVTVLQKELRSCSAPKLVEGRMGGVKVVVCPSRAVENSQGCLPCPLHVLWIVLHPLCLLSLCLWGRIWVRMVPAYGNLMEGHVSSG